MNLTETEFSKHVGTDFHTAVNGREVSLKLAQVKAYMPKENEQSGMERFSLFFEGPGNIRLPQAIYGLTHPQMGDMEIFLVPISGDANGFSYEAVFNYYKTES